MRQLLGDSDQSEARCLRRRYVFGQWLETLELSANHLVAIRKVADDEDVWLFDKDVMEADGWVVADSGSWSLPQARASSTTEEERS